MENLSGSLYARLTSRESSPIVAEGINPLHPVVVISEPYEEHLPLYTLPMHHALQLPVPNILHTTSHGQPDARDILQEGAEIDQMTQQLQALGLLGQTIYIIGDYEQAHPDIRMLDGLLRLPESPSVVLITEDFNLSEAGRAYGREFPGNFKILNKNPMLGRANIYSPLTLSQPGDCLGDLVRRKSRELFNGIMVPPWMRTTNVVREPLPAAMASS